MNHETGTNILKAAKTAGNFSGLAWWLRVENVGGGIVAAVISFGDEWEAICSDDPSGQGDYMVATYDEHGDQLGYVIVDGTEEAAAELAEAGRAFLYQRAK